jgi:hypothetical protein
MKFKEMPYKRPDPEAIIQTTKDQTERLSGGVPRLRTAK